MKLDPGIHIVMHSVLFLKPGVTHRNRHKEFNKVRIQRVVSSKHKTYQKRRIRTQNAREEGEDENSAHKGESQTNFIHKLQKNSPIQG